MKFTPKTEEELNKLLDPGFWDWECIQAEEKTSKAGNQMLHLINKCWDKNGRSALVHDYILDSFDWKIRNFAYAGGLDKRYEMGEIDAHICVGASGKCKGAIEKDKTGQYGDKNKIVDYIISDNLEPKKETPADLDDEIPF